MMNKKPEIFYRALLPKFTGGFYSELDECIKMLGVIADDSKADPLKLVIFHDPISEEEHLKRRGYVYDALGAAFPGNYPTFILVCQAPEQPYSVSMEAVYLKKNTSRLSFGEAGKNHYAIIEWPGFKELWASGLRGEKEAQTFDEAAVGSFETLLHILEKEKMNFNDIMRQWNYIGGILQNRMISNVTTINYQIFNEIRHRYYQQFRTKKGFPAATGIGSKFNNVDIDIIALQTTGPEMVTCAIENPNQINAYQYGQQVLEGSPILAQKVKHAPEFERAKLVIAQDYMRLFISGTASIIGQETIGKGDIEKQTLCTIDNIKLLTDSANIKRNYPLLPPGTFHHAFLRVYVKDPRHLDTVKSICREKYGDLPVNYIQTDICRDDLLMEIEGEMHFYPESQY